MSEPSSKTQTATRTADDHSSRTNSPSASVVTKDSRAAQILMAQCLAYSHLACFLAGACLIGLMFVSYIAIRASTRADLAELEVESFKNVLHEAKLPTSAHLPGESP